MCDISYRKLTFLLIIGLISLTLSNNGLVRAAEEGKQLNFQNENGHFHRAYSTLKKWKLKSPFTHFHCNPIVCTKTARFINHYGLFRKKCSCDATPPCCECNRSRDNKSYAISIRMR